MAAAPAYKEHWEENVIPFYHALPLLRTAAIYGPNGSGKSTLVDALRFMKDMVIRSAKDSQAGEPIDVEPFLLTRSTRESDSEFEIFFMENGVRFQYGFRANQTRVTEEWLYAYPEGRSQRWFHRAWDPNSEIDKYVWGRSFTGGRNRTLWQQQTRPNALFLSTAIQLNNSQLLPVYSWFKNRLRIVYGGKLSNTYTVLRCADESFRHEVLDFLQSSDLSIDDLKIIERKEDSDADKSNDLDSPEPTARLKVPELRFIRKDLDTNEPIEFTLRHESDGTRALLAFAGPWIDIQKNGRVLFIDEFDSSLHALIVQHLVKLLHKPDGQAQLVFTTHDTSLLGSRILRRDQVWFIERDAQHKGTKITALSEYGPRELEAIEKGYLMGRYHGIPSPKEPLQQPSQLPAETE